MRGFSLLYDAVFGGPLVPLGELERIVKEAQLSLPALVYAVPIGEALEASFSSELLKADGALLERGRRRVLNLPPAGSFWFIPAREVAHCPRYFLTDASRLVYALQQATLFQRQRDLEHWAGKPGGGLTLQDEVEAFALALQEARRGGVGEAVEIWSRVVLHRHHQQINAIRLRWVEFLTALTRGSDANVAYVSYSLIRAIYREHSLLKLGKMPARMVQEVMPLLAGRHALAAREAVRHPALGRAFAEMEEHFAEGIGLAEVALACHVSAAHLARIFKQETGQTVVAYLQRLRIQRACELLATSTKSLLEVAADSGFESVEHFHRLFRRQCGMTPRAYRLAHR